MIAVVNYRSSVDISSSVVRAKEKFCRRNTSASSPLPLLLPSVPLHSSSRPTPRSQHASALSKFRRRRRCVVVVPSPKNLPSRLPADHLAHGATDRRTAAGPPTTSGHQRRHRRHGQPQQPLRQHTGHFRFRLQLSRRRIRAPLRRTGQGQSRGAPAETGPDPTLGPEPDPGDLPAGDDRRNDEHAKVARDLPVPGASRRPPTRHQGAGQELHQRVSQRRGRRHARAVLTQVRR